MTEPVNIQIGGNVSGNIVVGDNNLVVNTNHGTIIYKQSATRVKAREFAAQPPRAPRGFINRSAELQKLEGWIAANEIVLLHGPDGMGKSALLKQAANSAAARAMPGGVIPLEPPDAEGLISGPDDLVQKLFDALFESQPRLKVNAISARSYLSNTRPLILLDEVPVPQALLNALPDLFPQGAILLAADVPGAGEFQRLRVGPLPRAEALTLLAGRAGLDVNESNRPALNQLCESLGDVALALTLTANALRESGLTLEQALSGMGAGAGAPANAQEALDRAFGLLFGLLSPEEQKILASAALTPGLSMTPEWLGSALGGQDASAFIERLKALGLLFANSPRLRLPPGLRASAQKSARGLISETGLFTALIEYLSQGLGDPEFIAAEFGNLLGAMTWATRHAEWGAAARLGRGMDATLTLNGLWDAWEGVLGLLRETADATSDAALQGWVLHQLGTRLLALGDKPGAESLLREALRIRQKTGDSTGAAYTQHNLDLLLPPAAPPAKPTPKIPRLWLGLGAALLLVAGIAAWLALPALLKPGPTATPSFTPRPALISSETPTASPTPSQTPPATKTATATASATPLGGSGLLAFQSQPGRASFVRKLSPQIFTLQVDVDSPHLLLDPLLAAQQPAWSPDGKRLAFASRDNQSGTSQIFTANADGSDLQQITFQQTENTHPSWSPDGTRLAFVASYQNGGSDLYITNPGGNGSAVAAGPQVTNLTQSDGTGHYDYPEWSPDGANLAFQSFVDNNWELFLIGTDGNSQAVRLTQAASGRENDWSIQPGWSPNGKLLAFASNRSGNWDIYILTLGSGEVRALTNDEFYDIEPDWSPDGLLLAFSSNRGGSQQIYLITSDGAVIRPVTKLPGENLEPDWLPGQ